MYAKHFYKNRSNVGQIFKNFAGMEGKMEETPINTERKGENIASLAGDGRITFYNSSSTAMTPLSTPVSPEKAMESNQRPSSGGCYFLTVSD